LHFLLLLLQLFALGLELLRLVFEEVAHLLEFALQARSCRLGGSSFGWGRHFFARSGGRCILPGRSLIIGGFASCRIIRPGHRGCYDETKGQNPPQ
jgi:hypothetical protein